MAKMPANIKLIISQFIAQVLVKAAGLKGWALKKLMEYGGQLIYDFVTNAISKWNRKAEQDAAKKKHEAVLNNPDSTVDERGKAYEERINAGRDN